MRQPLIIGNWKMNMSIADSVDFIKDLNETNNSVAQVGLAPQYPCLNDMVKTKGEILVGAQNVNDHLSGAYTGEVSVELLAELKVDFCIIGHSERRMYYNETDSAINTKAKLLLENKIMPVICVGESEEEYDNGKTSEVITRQIKESCADLDIKKCAIAYEPVWAIGTGKSATSEIAQSVCAQIRAILATMYDSNTADAVRIMYGGSVKETNIAEYMAQEDVDGALVGGASLKIDSFTSLINYK